MKFFLISLTCVTFFSVAALATTYNCEVLSDQDQKSTITLMNKDSGEKFIKIDQMNPLLVLKIVQMKLTSAQVDKCDINGEFDKCLKVVFGTLNPYQKEIPAILAYLRFHSHLGNISLNFDTNKIASGEIFFVTDFNPASGSVGLIRFYDNKNRPLGQIMELGMGQLSECKEVEIKKIY